MRALCAGHAVQAACRSAGVSDYPPSPSLPWFDLLAHPAQVRHEARSKVWGIKPLGRVILCSL